MPFSDSTGYLEGGLDVFGSPSDGQVPEWIASRSRAEWSSLPAAGFEPTSAELQCAASTPFVKVVAGTDSFYPPWTLQNKTLGSTYAIETVVVSGVNVIGIVPDGAGIYLLRWQGFVSVDAQPAADSNQTLRFARGSNNFTDDWRSDEFIWLGQELFFCGRGMLIVHDDPVEKHLRAFINPFAEPPATISSSTVNFLDITKIAPATP